MHILWCSTRIVQKRSKDLIVMLLTILFMLCPIPDTIHFLVYRYTHVTHFINEQWFNDNKLIQCELYW